MPSAVSDAETGDLRSQLDMPFIEAVVDKLHRVDTYSRMEGEGYIQEQTLLIGHKADDVRVGSGVGVFWCRCVPVL